MIARPFVLATLALVVTAFPAAAQPEPNDPDDVPTRIIDGLGVDIVGGSTGPQGRFFRGRPAAEFELLFRLERDFLAEIPDDAERPAMR